MERRRQLVVRDVRIEIPVAVHVEECARSDRGCLRTGRAGKRDGFSKIASPVVRRDDEARRSVILPGSIADPEPYRVKLVDARAATDAAGALDLKGGGA